MSQCGPVNPCELCLPPYAQSPDWEPDPDRPGSFRVARSHVERRRPNRSQAPVQDVDRLPVVTGSRTSIRARRRARQRRTS